MIPALLVYWTRDKDGVGCWKVKQCFHPNTRSVLSRFHTKLEALAYADKLFRHENWVLLTVLNKDDSQDHCMSKFKDLPLWSYLNETKETAS